MTDNAREYSASSDAADSGQQALIDRAEHVLSKDDRVLGVWLVGSFGRGTHDRFSDVDLWVVVAADDADSFCDDWPKTSDEISPTVFRRALGPRVFNHITPDWLRFDVSVGTPDAIGSRTRSTAKPLYDPHGLSAELAAPGAPRQPDPHRVESITVEFLRVLGLLPVAIGREEYVVGQSGAGLLRQMLIDLMLEDVAVEDRGGALHLDRLLPADRQQLLADLPPLQATRESVITANLTCAAHFLPLARTLHTRCGITWPQELEDAARQHLLTTLSVDPG
ncbi:nucleotidyltransferase-like protein [Kribbella rubisoli]|uniref:Nucleotidyltransferase-like protein n=1 Tax=Kribbella rubisoli TaxID=3075929 RepID=A0A4Q7WU60_9ACTN|nr:nucleotidyltransferase domain-containing protein [Kribbella rubisoli]RZU13901.1 nucleotidyltransferase-like protein [Kribbella rubisoli]